jgi:hypothetical protein
MRTALFCLFAVLPQLAAAEPYAMRDDDAVSQSADLDGDGVANARDNCRELVNLDQADVDGDGVGDACDLDDDNDGVADAADNCPFRANSSQADGDDDGAGDVCDAHFDTMVSVELMSALASRSDELLASLPGDAGRAPRQRLDAAVAAVVDASQAWDAGAASRARYEASLRTALETLTEFDLKLAARASSGDLAPETAALLRDASGGIRHLVARLYVH